MPTRFRYLRVPEGFDNYTVQFDEAPREKVPQVTAIALAPLIARYAPLRPADLAAKSTEELSAIRDALAPHREELLLVATSDARADTIDDLPKDVF